MNKMILILLGLFGLILISSCGNEETHKDIKASGRFESVNSGTFTAYVDESVWNFLQPVFKMYDSTYSDIHPKFIKTSSRNAMRMFLAGESKVIITPRGYLHDEDSLMKVYHVKPYEQGVYAKDALVFYTQKDFPTDTLTDEQIKKVLTNEETTLKEYYPILEDEPDFVCNDVNSSEFANLKQLVTKGPVIFSKLTFAKNSDLVKDYILQHKNAIGIGYLSQVIDNDNLKCLGISFIDSSGKYYFPHVVHQSNIVREYYPYIVNHYVYLMSNIQNRVFWFARFLEREYKVQLYFNQSGIVPTYAKIKLVEE